MQGLGNLALKKAALWLPRPALNAPLLYLLLAKARPGRTPLSSQQALSPRKVCGIQYFLFPGSDAGWGLAWRLDLCGSHSWSLAFPLPNVPQLGHSCHSTSLTQHPLTCL